MTDPNPPLRYQEKGNVHLDFHGAANTTIDFIVARFGTEALHEVFRRVATDVHQDLRGQLMAGDAAAIVRHWRHFLSAKRSILTLPSARRRSS